MEHAFLKTFHRKINLVKTDKSCKKRNAMACGKVKFNTTVHEIKQSINF